MWMDAMSIVEFKVALQIETRRSQCHPPGLEICSLEDIGCIPFFAEFDDHVVRSIAREPHQKGAGGRMVDLGIMQYFLEAFWLALIFHRSASDTAT